MLFLYYDSTNTLILKIVLVLLIYVCIIWGYEFSWVLYITCISNILSKYNDFENFNIKSGNGLLIWSMEPQWKSTEIAFETIQEKEN